MMADEEHYAFAPPQHAVLAAACLSLMFCTAACGSVHQQDVLLCRRSARARSSRRTLMASSASMLQCSLTGGRERCFAMSLFLMDVALSSVCPFTHSVATLLLAMAEPQPKVLKQESIMLPSAST